MQSRAKYKTPEYFEKVLEILDKKVSLAVIQNVFSALYPDKTELTGRIRICKICERIYWAIRKDSNTCSARCLNTLNVRRHRAESVN